MDDEPLTQCRTADSRRERGKRSIANCAACLFPSDCTRGRFVRGMNPQRELALAVHIASPEPRHHEQTFNYESRRGLFFRKDFLWKEQ